MTTIEQSQQPASNLDVARWQDITALQVEVIAGVVARILETYAFAERKEIQAIQPSTILPFKAAVLPANEAVLEKVFPGYTPPSPEMLASHKEYAGAPENYGSAPEEASALLVQLTKAIQPETAFVFGTARGRLEQLIAQSCDLTEIVTIDLPTALVAVAPGKPDSNNIRYREKIGIDNDSKIGDIFRADPDISDRMHQILGDSFTFSPERLRNTMRLIVVDGNHQLPNCLMDLANALDMAHEDGAVIMVDDFRKKDFPLNSGVDGAVANFSQITGLPALMPCPRPGEKGLQASAAILVVPSDYQKKAEMVSTLRSLATMLKSYE
jgi:hypothetical protein